MGVQYDAGAHFIKLNGDVNEVFGDYHVFISFKLINRQRSNYTILINVEVPSELFPPTVD